MTWADGLILGKVFIYLHTEEDRLCIYKYIYRNMCFTIMAQLRQLICQCRWRKFTNTLGPKKRYLFEMNKSAVV
jgi:hypothetical protein